MSDVAGELARLQELRDKGTLSHADFDTMKADVLRRATSPEVVAAPLMPSSASTTSTPSNTGSPKPADRRTRRNAAVVAVVVAAVVVIGALILQAM
jgi:hypothetical protein